MPFQLSSGPSASALNAPAYLIQIPQKGIYQIFLNTNVAAQDTPAGDVQTAYLTLFKNQLPLLKTAQYTAGDITTTASSSATTQIFELDEGDLVYAYAELPSVTAQGFLNIWLRETDFSSTIKSGSFFELFKLPENLAWMQALDLQNAVALSSTTLTRIPFSSLQGPLASCLTSQSLFVAPRSGIYQFDGNVSIWSNWSTEINAYILLVVNGLPAWMLSQMAAGPGGSFLTGAQLSQIVYLDEGDYVSLEASSPSGGPMYAWSLLPAPAIPQQAPNPLCSTWFAAKFLEDTAGSAPTQWFRAVLVEPQVINIDYRSIVRSTSATGPMSSSFSTATCVFEAPMTGLYEVKVCLSIFASDATAVAFQLSVWVNDDQLATQSQVVSKTVAGTTGSMSLAKLLSVQEKDQIYLTIQSASGVSGTILANITPAPGYPPVPSSWWTCRFIQ